MGFLLSGLRFNTGVTQAEESPSLPTALGAEPSSLPLPSSPGLTSPLTPTKLTALSITAAALLPPPPLLLPSYHSPSISSTPPGSTARYHHVRPWPRGRRTRTAWTRTLLAASPSPSSATRRSRACSSSASGPGPSEHRCPRRSYLCPFISFLVSFSPAGLRYATVLIVIAAVTCVCNG